jgi:hypothetical protein
MYDKSTLDSATAHRANIAVTAVVVVFGEELIGLIRGLWPARFTDLNPCDYYLWGTLKDRCHVKNPHCLHGGKKNTRR